MRDKQHSALIGWHSTPWHGSVPLTYYPVSHAPHLPAIYYSQPALSLAAGYASAAEKIGHYSAWGEGWDGEGASQISAEAASRAKNALQTFSWLLPVPEITPNSNGTVSMEWETPAGTANFEIGNTRYAGYVSGTNFPTTYFNETHKNVDACVGAIVHAFLFASQKPADIVTSVEVANVR